MSKAADRPLTVLVYSDDATVRTAIRAAIGRRPAADLPLVECEEFATEPALVRRLDKGGVDLAILDGEAVPSGGMGVARRIKTEIYAAPPVLLITGRPQDAWLATWSQADAVVPQPIDPMLLAKAAAALLRPRLAVTGS